MQVNRIGWTNLPLLFFSVVLLVVTWFVAPNRDPGGQGDILVSMILMTRALAMPQVQMGNPQWMRSRFHRSRGECGDSVPTGFWHICSSVLILIFATIVLFWERLAW